MTSKQPRLFVPRFGESNRVCAICDVPIDARGETQHGRMHVRRGEATESDIHDGYPSERSVYGQVDTSRRVFYRTPPLHAPLSK